METGCEFLPTIQGIYFYELEDGSLLCFDEYEYYTAQQGMNPFTQQQLPQGQWVKLTSQHQLRGGNVNIIEKVMMKLRGDRTAPADLNDVIQIIRDADPSPNKKYVKWIIESYKWDGINLFEDISSRIKPALEDYVLLLNRNILQNTERNLHNYCGLVGCRTKKRTKEGLEDLIDKYQEEINRIRGVQQLELKGRKEGELIYDGKTIMVIHPTTQDAACYYGRETRWCTSSKQATNRFQNYNAQGPLYIIIPKNPQYQGEKYQFHFETNSFMNEKDVRVNLSDIISDYPDLVSELPPSDFRSKMQIRILKIAIQRGLISEIQNLLDQGYLLDDYELLELLLPDILQKQNVSTSFEGSLREVIKSNNLKHVETLIDIAKLVGSDFKKSSMLRIAAEGGNVQIVKMLEEAGANYEDMVLVRAIVKGHFNVVKYLVEKGGVNLENPRFVEDAVQYGHVNMLEYLINNEAEIPNNILFVAANYDRWEIFKYLMNLDVRLDVDARSRVTWDPETVLMMLSRKGKLELVKMLVEANANVNIKVKGKTALWWAERKNHLATANYLRNQGATE